VMEFLDGETLAERLCRGALPIKLTLKIGIEVSEALEVAHRAGIVHRDLKPGNIMLTKAGAKLMDFGLAKSAMSGLAAAASNAPLLSAARTISEGSPLSPLTTAGAVIGTIQYMSPEQIEGKEADARSDLFALGAVLYEMSTGKRPFEGKSQISVASAILDNDPEPISRIQPLTPPVFDHVVTTCLAKNPDDRFRTAHDVRLELKWVAEVAARLEPLQSPRSKARSRILLWAMASLGVILLFVGGKYLVSRHIDSAVRYTRVTYREGNLQSARFSRDGQTIVYSGQWEGEPLQVAVARLGSPESRPLGIPSAGIAALSSSDELAVLRGCDFVYMNNCIGTLATVSLAGGSPRDLAEHVAYADWTPDGKQLAVSVYSREGARLEYPAGHVIYEQKTGWFGHPRFSPDGSMIAYENHSFANDDEGSIEVVDLRGKRTILSKASLSLEGLAWSSDGKEVWYAGSTHAGWADSVQAVSLSGKERVVLSVPSGVRLHDIARDGRVLLSRESWRTQLKGVFPGDAHERAYSWLDNTEMTAISSNGQAITFYEAGDTYYIEQDATAYYRRTDGSAPVRLGGGRAVLSPDGKSLVAFSAKHRKLTLQSLGAGEPKELPSSDLDGFDHLVWSDNGQQIAYEAHTSRNEWNVYTQRVRGGTPILVKATARNSFPVLTPDGAMLAIREEHGGISLFHTGDNNSVPVKGVLNSEYPVRFAKGGTSLLVADPTAQELVITFVELSSGHREEWKRFTTEPDTYAAAPLFVVTPDLKYYAYHSPRNVSDLYLADGLR
jgi:eukaryotic-like serine/threonine-protein kinase